jgi:hypothetical protein
MTMSFKTLGTAPGAVTQPASSVTTTSATLAAIVNPNYISTAVVFEYGQTTSYGETAVASQSPVTGSTSTEVSAEITGLAEGTTYHFRVKSTNSEGTDYGDDLTFKSLGNVPTATITAATNLTAISVQLNGIVNANYLASTVTFEYGITTDYGNNITATPGLVAGNENTIVNALISDLSAATIYHSRIKAVNIIGSAYSNDMTFTTPGEAPAATTGVATKVTLNSATLNGIVNANFLPADVTFEYGTTTDYGSSMAISQNPISGNVNSDVKENVSGLIENTTYHFRIKAINSLGTTYGNDVSFKTFPLDFPVDGLVAYYTFAGGNALDLSSYGNNGVISGAAPSNDRFSKPNESFHFGSEDDYIIVRHPGFLDNNVGTIAAWVKFDDLEHVQYVASVGDTNSVNNYLGFIRLDQLSHTLGVFQREPSSMNWVNGTTVISPDVYYHVVLTSDGLNWSIYINGVKEALEIKSGSNTGKWISYLSGIDNFVIGNCIIEKPYTVPYLSGNIDEILLYNRTLTESELINLYTLTLEE